MILYTLCIEEMTHCTSEYKYYCMVPIIKYVEESEYSHTPELLPYIFFFFYSVVKSTYNKLCIPLQLQDLRCVLLDHKQLMLSQHLLLGKELKLGGMLQ